MNKCCWSLQSVWIKFSDSKDPLLFVRWRRCLPPSLQTQQETWTIKIWSTSSPMARRRIRSEHHHLSSKLSLVCIISHSKRDGEQTLTSLHLLSHDFLFSSAQLYFSLCGADKHTVSGHSDLYTPPVLWICIHLCYLKTGKHPACTQHQMKCLFFIVTCYPSLALLNRFPGGQLFQDTNHLLWARALYFLICGSAIGWSLAPSSGSGVVVQIGMSTDYSRQMKNSVSYFAL